MLTGLLYAAVIAMWAVVLLPRWLGTSDRYRDTRTSQRFRNSLRSVSGRRHRSHDVAVMPDGSSSRVDVAPADSAIDAHLDLGIDPFIGTAEDGRRLSVRSQQIREQASVDAATRRKRILLGLVAGTGVTLVGALFSFVSITWFLLFGAGLAGYVYLLRSQALARRPRGDSQRQAGDADTRAAADASTWEPVSSPEPSYMRAPRATAVPREIDSDQNGPWNAERMLEQAAALRSGEDEESELGLDEYAYPGRYSRPRAVNE